MINPYTGEFLYDPCAIEISGNTCSHNCTYCYANTRKDARKCELTSVINRLKRVNQNVYLDHLIHEGYPICFSNRSDPFSKNNYIPSLSILQYLAILPNGIGLQTKGGYCIDEALDILKDKKNITWYITISILNEKIRERIEPNAPTIQSRLDLVQRLKGLGYHVIIGMNPLVEDWLPFEDFIILTEKLESYGIKHFDCEPLHINKKEIGNLAEWKKIAIGDKLLNQTKIEAFTYLEKCFDYFFEKDLHYDKCGMPYPSRCMHDKRMALGGKGFPSQYDIINFCYQKLQKEGNGFILTCNEYLDICCGRGNLEFFNKPFNNLANLYILRRAFNTWKGDKIIQSINTLKGILQMYWNYKEVKISMQNNFLYRIVKDKNNIVYDKRNNIQLYFDGDIHYGDRFFQI